MTQRMERRLGRLEAAQQYLTIAAMAKTIAPEMGIDVDELVADTEAMLAECRRYGLTTLDAMIEHFAGKDGIRPEVLRREMDALGAMR